MTTGRQVDKELKGIAQGVKHLNEGTSRKLQTLSFMTLLWPLLPNLPPEPPLAAARLLKENPLDSCDVCGCPTTPSPLQKRRIGESGPPSPGTQTQIKSAPGVESPLAKMMEEIEKKVDDTLTSIETTAKQTDKLAKETKELEMTGLSGVTDAALVDTLKMLMKEKAGREERIKALELKEQQLKDSLKTAINWAKSVDTK